MNGPGRILPLILILAASYGARVWFRSHIVSMITRDGITSDGPDCLDLVGNTTTEDEGSTFIVGSFKNNCDHGFGQITVLFSVDPPAGPQGNLPEAVAYAYSRDVKAGETRDFKTALPVSRNASYRFKGINAF